MFRAPAERWIFTCPTASKVSVEIEWPNRPQKKYVLLCITFNICDCPQSLTINTWEKGCFVWISDQNSEFDFAGSVVAWYPTHTSMHTSQSGELSDFDILAGVQIMTDFQGSHAWGVFARHLLQLYPQRLEAIQQLNWKERADKVSARKWKSFLKTSYDTNSPGSSCNRRQVSLHLSRLPDSLLSGSGQNRATWQSFIIALDALLHPTSHRLACKHVFTPQFPPRKSAQQNENLSDKHIFLAEIQDSDFLHFFLMGLWWGNHDEDDRDDQLLSLQAPAGSSGLCLQDDFSELASVEEIFPATVKSNSSDALLPT